MKYIYQHLGLGDHIICNGLVRSLIKPDEKYSMFVKPHNKISVEFMYRDLTNLSFICGDDSFVNKFINENNIKNTDLIIFGFEGHPNYSWDEVFYVQHNIDFKKRWESFNVERDFNMEDYLYQVLNPNNQDFALIHKAGSDDCDRINYDMINPNLKKIYVEKHTENIFDYLKLIELAKEVHCVESSFHLLVDSVDLNKNLFFHTLKRSRGFLHKIKNKWNIV
jgi:hypothetical protein